MRGIRKWVIAAAVVAVVALAVVLVVMRACARDGEVPPEEVEVRGVPKPHKEKREAAKPAIEEAQPATTSQQEPPPAAAPTQNPFATLTNPNATGPRIADDITSSIPRVRQPKDVRKVVAILSNPEEDDTVRNEAVNLLRRSGYACLTDDLISLLGNPEEGPRFRAFCVQHLSNINKTARPEERERIAKSFHALLEDRHVQVRREALLALVRAGDPKGEETAVKWLTEPGYQDVRDLAIRCVHMLDLKQQVPGVRRYAYDRDEVVRIAAVVALSQWGDEASRPAFETAAKSKSVRLQRAGKAALERFNKTVQ